MGISLFADSYTEKSPDKLMDIRLVGAIMGCYSLASRKKGSESHPSVLACRVQSISPTSVVMSAPVRGEIGEHVSAKFDDFEIIEGRISRIIDGGFVLDIVTDDEGRTKIAAKIDWLKKRRFRAFKDKRSQKRIMPPNPKSAVTFPDASVVECLVMDVSRTGTAVSCGTSAPVGTRVAVGRATGVIARHVEGGFAVRFDKKLDLNEVDGVFAWALKHLGNATGKPADEKSAVDYSTA